MRTFALALAAGLAIASTASAGWVENRSEWNALGADKITYVAGLSDGIIIGDTTPYGDAMAFGMHRCVKELQITGADLVTMIDAAYAADVANWSKAPSSLFVSEMFRMCRTQINQERAQRGLDLIPES